MKILVYSILLAFSLTTAVAQSSSTHIEVAGNDFKENLINSIYESSVLNYFWAGDDGVECGEPILDKLIIDYSKKEIAFEANPAGLAATCETRSMNCKIDFTESEEGAIVFSNRPVYLYGDGCSL